MGSLNRGGAGIRVEVKNADTVAYADGGGKLDLRRSAPINGERLYRADDFDVLGVCLAPLTGRWEFLWQAATHLARKPGSVDFLDPNVRIDSLFTPCFADAVTRARTAGAGTPRDLVLF